jgi:hypothetical protein
MNTSRPYPSRLDRRKPPMTIAAGFLCDDGIVICADREVSTGSDKWEESKIFTLHTDAETPKTNAIIAGSGWLDYVKMTVDKIRKRAMFMSTALEIEEAVEETVLEVHRKHIRFYSGDEKPNFDLIVGIRDDSGLVLLQSIGTSVRRVPTRFSCIGVGQTLASYISRKLNPQDDTASEAALLAVQILEQVKANVPECGGLFSDVAVLPKDGPLIRINPSALLDIGNRSREFALLLKPLLMSVTNPTLSEEDFEERILELTQKCRHIRMESQERMRRARSGKK